MRQAFLVSLFLSAATAYGQVAASRKPINLDSLIAVQNEKKAALTGKPYPGFFALAGNKEISNISLKGKVVFINFWFASCAPCIAEMEDLNKLYNKFKHF
jgi:thiol-disulfide isomerase/thioredoxin